MKNKLKSTIAIVLCAMMLISMLTVATTANAVETSDNSVGATTDWYLLGEFNNWTQSESSKFSNNEISIKVTTLPSNGYQFKLFSGIYWYGTQSKITVNNTTTSNITFIQNAGYNVTWNVTTVGTYVFTLSGLKLSIKKGTEPTTEEPTTVEPTEEPTTEPVTEPTTVEPTELPTTEPVTEPTTVEPTEVPTTEPVTEPTTVEPTEEPTTEPVTEPTTVEPTTQPVTQPTTQPSVTHDVTINFKTSSTYAYIPKLYVDGQRVVMTKGMYIGDTVSGSIKFYWYNAKISVDTNKQTNLQILTNRTIMNVSISKVLSKDEYYFGVNDLMDGTTMVDLTDEKEYIRNYHHTARHMVYSSTDTDGTLGFTNINGQTYQMGSLTEDLTEMSYNFFASNKALVPVGVSYFSSSFSVKSATAMQLVGVKKANYSELQTSLLDVNLDGIVNVLDATLMQKTLAGV